MTENRSIGAIMISTAILLSLVNSSFVWIIIMYPVTATLGAVHFYFHFLTGSIIFSIIFFWALYSSERVSEIVYRSCRFGAILSLLLPVITGLISIFWAIGVVDRPTDFFTGFSPLEIPVYTAGIAIVLIFLFLGASYIAERKS